MILLHHKLSLIMRNLLRRVYRLYRDEGLKPVISQSWKYAIGRLHYRLGFAFLFEYEAYRTFLSWWNSGQRRFDARANPLKIYQVPPDEIRFITERDPFPGDFMWQHLGLIYDGDWDRTDTRFEDLPLYQGLKQHFEDGVPWEETVFIQHVRNQMKHGRADWKSVSNEEELDRGCARVDRLYKRIRVNGYRTMEELVESGTVDPANHRLPKKLLKSDEVAVDIGRDGEFLFVDGRHRLSIAKILNLKTIPVRVVARHEQWQKKRERIAKANVPADLPRSISKHLEHPDIQDCLSIESDTNTKKNN